MNDLSVFEYFYCDASNYTVWGSVVLLGRVTEADRQLLLQHFTASEFFIAEQLGIPPLYTELWDLSGGPTSADHVWHTFHALRLAGPEDINALAVDTVANFIARTRSVQHWDEKLSPHWAWTAE